MSFKRVEVKAGETVELSLPIYYDDLKFYHPEEKSWALDDSYNVYVGENARAADGQFITVNFAVENVVA